jgi:alanyl-tRNA synthetase
MARGLAGLAGVEPVKTMPLWRGSWGQPSARRLGGRTMQTVSDIRTAFLDFFQGHGHKVVASSPLVPRNDPTLLFTNAGMVQFKNLFTGAENRNYARAATSQKCVRAGGKHNDLENVGYTARHHTFFEMLGNFSFGDYFKETAIEHAWNLITREYGLDKDRLLVTVYAEDEEAAALWRKIGGLGDDRIIRIATSDNFWAMGDTGPCGPCSEIFYDHGDHIPGGPPGSADEDGDRFIEIWNLVFMQYEQVTKEQRINLPRPSIDTGMGLERISAVMQGHHDNYDIDLMRSLIEASADASNQDADGLHKISHRVIADHLRASSFLIADGVLPSNEGRGYVLRRIMRRAMRHAHIIGCKDPLMWRLAPALVRQMGDAFSELQRAESLIVETLKLEESRFKETLERGLRQLEYATDGLGDGEDLPGEVAFKLYDTFGFPLDLTQDILRGKGRKVEQQGFDTSMGRQRASARAAWSGSGDATTDGLWFDLYQRVGASEFFGHATEAAEGQVVSLVSDGAEIDAIDSTEATGAVTGEERVPAPEILVIVNQTPFYGESGGQMGDAGQMLSVDGAVVEISDTQKRVGELVVHSGRLLKGRLVVGDAVALKVDPIRRARLRANHSATHLLHEALRRHLGEHVTQKGSQVAPERLRFDFSHSKAVDRATLKLVESEVNARIRENLLVTTTLMDPKSAIEAGAMALFGEKYGEEVRVVSMGGGDAREDKAVYSVELCGGTHVSRTGDISVFRVLSEGAVASGVRRIEAVTGIGALDYFDMRDGFLDQVSASLKASPDQLPDRVSALVEDRRRLEREVQDLRRKLASGAGTSNGAATTTVAGVQFAGRFLEEVPARELKSMADGLKQEIGSGVVAIAASYEGKASLVVGVTTDLAERISAVDLVRAGAPALGGKGGGGRADMAQAGGPNADSAAAALAAVEAALSGLGAG